MTRIPCQLQSSFDCNSASLYYQKSCILLVSICRILLDQDQKINRLYIMCMKGKQNSPYCSKCLSIYRFMRKRRPRSLSSTSDKELASQEEEEQETLDVSPKMIIIFVILMCSLLVALYFLYDYLGKKFYLQLKKYTLVCN